MAFTLYETAASVAVLGSTGYVGSVLVVQLRGQRKMLADNLGMQMCVSVAASSTRMVLEDATRGLDIDKVDDMLNEDEDGGNKAHPFDLDRITDVMAADVKPLRVVVDCTNSDEVCRYYERWLSSGVHVISPGRKVASGDLDTYRRVIQAQKENAVNWQYESSVGSALPVITTLRDLLETGDKIYRIRGSLSGTMAYVLSAFSEDVSFSEAVRRVFDLGYTENDLREDLGGLDMASKVVIMARQAGLDVKIEDVEVESLIPEEILKRSYAGNREEMTEAILEDIRCVDEPMLEQLRDAEATGSALRYKFVIEPETGKCRCVLATVNNTDPLFRLKKNENLVAFETSRYETSPLIVKGAAAGPDLAAAGIFAILLRLSRAYSSLPG